MRYADALAWLYSRQKYGVKMGLETIGGLLDRLGRPQDAFRALHVTGTNGKGSTCAFLDAALRSAGHRVGLFTSPHLVRFPERILIDGKPVADADVAAGVERLRPIVESVETGHTRPTFFECVTALAFDLFRTRGISIVVLEVGMGGRLDATNVCNPLVTVITNVGLDHTHYLGTSIQAIAQEKAGILKRGVAAITGARGPALDVVARRATATGTPLRAVRAPDPVHATLEATRFSQPYLGIPTPFETGLLGAHQAHNAALALAALEACAAQLPVAQEAAQRGIRSTQWPGRLEAVGHDPTLLLDGAHNAPAMDTLGRFLDEVAPDHRVAAVVGILRDKEASKMLSILAPRVSRLVLTRVPNERSLNPEELRRMLPADAPPTQVEPEPTAAFRKAFAEGDEPIRLVTGSLFLVGEARVRLLRLERDPPVAAPVTQ